MSNWGFGKLLDAALLLQLVALVAILLDVPFLRQVIGFVYLSFLPGFLVLRAIRLDRTSLIENVLFSVGLSLAILMLIGLIADQVFPLLYVLRPLSAFPLIVALFAFTSVSYVVSSYRTRNVSERTTISLRFSHIVPLLFCIPIVTIFGTEMLVSSGNNIILLALVVIISVIVLCTFSEKLVPSETYLLVVLVISLFLLFHVSLTSHFIIGYDIHLEYYFANLTSIESRWISTISQEYNGMLSVTILPVLFSNLLNLDVNWVFKVVYPLIFSLVPLSLFATYRKLTGPRIALLSVFFFVSMDVFYFTMLGLARQMIAELFFALLILLTVEDRISLPKRRLLFIIFGAALIVSHYATSYIFMFYILLTFCLARLWKRSDVERGKLITADLVLLYVTMDIVWYVLVAPAPFEALAFTLDHIYQSILGQAYPPGISGLVPHFVSPLHEVSKYLFYGLQLSIIVGFVGSIIRYKHTKFSREYFSMSLTSLFILIACMVVPSFAAGLEMSRFYHITSFVLAPFIVLGILTIFGSIMNLTSYLPTSKARRLPTHDVKSKGAGLLLASFVLVSFFLFQIGFVYEIAGDAPSSLSLSFSRLQANPFLALDIWLAETPTQDIFSAKWLSNHRDSQSNIYADRTSSKMVLTSYGMNPTVYFSANSRLGTWDYLLSPTGARPGEDAYIYLRTLNVVYDKMNGPFAGRYWNTTAISPFLNSCSKIYTDGDSEIYKNPQ